MTGHFFWLKLSGVHHTQIMAESPADGIKGITKTIHALTYRLSPWPLMPEKADSLAWMLVKGSDEYLSFA